MKVTRRTFIKRSSAVAATASLAVNSGFHLLEGNRSSDPMVIGHGGFRYRVDSQWGNLNPSRNPVKNCHEMVMDAKGRLIMVTDETKNNIIIYDKSGKLLDF